MQLVPVVHAARTGAQGKGTEVKQMRVGIDEAGHHRCAAQIDGAGSCARGRHNIGTVADCKHAAGSDRQRLLRQRRAV